MITSIEVNKSAVNYVSEQTGLDPEDAEILISEILSLCTINPGGGPARQKMYFATVRGKDKFGNYIVEVHCNFLSTDFGA